MRYKILKGGVQINVIESTPEFCAEYCAANGYTYQEAPLPETPPPEPEPPAPTLDERVTSLETEKASQADVDELNEALNMILTGYTGEEGTDEAGTEG